MAPPNLQAIRKPEQKQARLSMPVGGLNLIASTVNFPETDAYLVDNIIVRPFGCEIRKGWKQWYPVANAFAGTVRTVMAFVAANPSNNKLWCSPSTNGQIYDITSPNVAPSSVLTPTGTPTTLGLWYSVQFVTPAAAFLCAVAEGSGYYIYSVSGGWAAQALTFPGGDSSTVADLSFVFTWKNRVWFLRRNSSIAYYLPVNSISGTLASFDFGPQLLHGGYLQWAASWTYDSGSGIDDSLIICSNAGDLLLWEGTDPSSSNTFALKGTWYVGRQPVGRRNFCQHGGNTLILSEYGITSIADLVAGRLHTSGIAQGLAYKVNTRLARLVSQYLTNEYWFMLTFPTEEILTVGTPYTDAQLGIRQSYCMNSITQAWSTFSNLDMLCGTVYDGQYIFGTRTGMVGSALVGVRDGDSSDSLTVGTEVTARIQTGFHNLGSPTMNKRLLRTKFYGLAEGLPAVYVVFKDEYDLNELLNVSSPIPTGKSIWDTAKWDETKWDLQRGSFKRWIGVAAVGKKLSMQCAVRGAGETLLTDYEVLFEEGINL